MFWNNMWNLIVTAFSSLAIDNVWMLVYCNTQRVTYFCIVVFVKNISKQFSYISVSQCLQFRIYTFWECLHSEITSFNIIVVLKRKILKHFPYNFDSLLGPQYWSEDDNLRYMHYYNANCLRSCIYSINCKTVTSRTTLGPQERFKVQYRNIRRAI